MVNSNLKKLEQLINNKKIEIPMNIESCAPKKENVLECCNTKINKCIVFTNTRSDWIEAKFTSKIGKKIDSDYTAFKLKEVETRSTIVNTLLKEIY
jgi:hypothetical protein